MHKAKLILFIIYVSLFTYANAEASTVDRVQNWITEKFKRSSDGSLEYGAFSSDSGRYYYELGGTDLTSPTFGVLDNSTTLLDFSASAGISYSCGNLSANYRATLERLNQAIQNLPANLQNMAGQALESGLAALPMYILNEANPVLAQVFSNSMFTLDENFRMSVKSCEQLESSILAGNGYGDWVTFNISKGMQERLPQLQLDEPTITGSEFVTQAQQNANCNHTDKNERGVKWLEGGMYGDSSNPLKIEEHTVIAGYNALRGYKYMGENTLDSNDSASTDDKKKKPFMRQWQTPQAAAKFVKNIIGSRSVTLCAGQKAEVSVSVGTGRTLKAEYDYYNEQFKKLIIDIIYKPTAVTAAQYKSLGSLEISTELLEKIRRQKPTTQMISISNLASAYAYEKARMLALDAINLMRVGRQTQFIASATPAKSYIDEAIKRLNDDISDLKQSAEPSKAANTILQILDN